MPVNRQEALKILMDLCESDLRCLDAHAHLGNFAFDGLAKDAIRHFEVGVCIGELSLGDGFDGVLEWGHSFQSEAVQTQTDAHSPRRPE